MSGVLLGAMSELSKMLWVCGEGGEDHPLLVVRTTEHLKSRLFSLTIIQIVGHLVVVKIELVPNTEPVSTLLTSKALEVINVRSCTHHHLKGGDHLRGRPW